MYRIIKLLKLSAIFIFIIVFSLTIICLPAGGKIYAQSGQIKVYIDAGHGGRDPGAVRFDLQEKDPNLDIALRLKSKLEANGFIVVMSRTNDSYLTLDERVNKANSSGADIFLSIHNNAALSQYAHGTETFWSSNGVSGSSQFASLVQTNLVKQIGRANRGVKTANFRVIKYTKMPAALVECAFVSNPTEAELLKSASFREKCATGLFNAIAAFSKGIDKSSGQYSESSSENSSGFTVKIDKPENNFVATKDFTISGWAADLKNSPAIQLAKVEFYNGAQRSESNLLGRVSSFADNVLGSTGVLNGGWEQTIEINKLNEGENIIYAYAYDASNNYSMANVKVNAIKDGDTGSDINLNPTASPGGPYTATVGEELTFDGSASSDSDGEIAQYIWDFGDDSTGSGVSPAHTYNEAGQYTVTLTVKDDGEALSAEVATIVTVEEESIDEEGIEEEDEEILTGQFESVSNETSIIGYIDLTVDDLVKIFEDRNSTKVDWAKRIAPLYIEYGRLFNMRADIAWAQMCHETGFLEYTGDVSPNQNNFVGIGATGGGVPGNSFETEELGIIAHYAHLAWYYYPTHINEYCSSEYDPRHFGDSHSRYTGDTTLGFLNGRWAPGSNYTDKIILFANEIIQGIDQTATPPEQTVIAEAGDDKIADVGDKLTFDASQSTVSPISEETVITYSWDWDGDGTYDETTEEAVITYIYEEAGTYEAALKVTAFENISATDTLTVTINDINEIPTASPGGPYTATAGEEITFDGLASSDSDGEIAQYIWDFGDGSTGSGVSPVHAYSEAGEYTVSLTVKDDGDSLSSEVTTTVTVEEDQITPPEQTVIAEAGDDKTAEVGEEITFDASASTVSPISEETVITYSWDWDGDGTYDETTEEAVITYIYEESGTYEVTLKVTAFDSVSATDTLTVTINDINEVPIASPGGPYITTAGEEITFDGSGSSDPDGSITEYIWGFGDDSTGSEVAPIHTYAEAGTYTVTLTVVDDSGTSSDAVSTTAVITDAVISQESTGETEPTVTAEAGEAISANVGESLTFDASASTVSPLSEDIVITYAWDWDGDGTYDETVNEAAVTHTYDKAGTYKVSLKVTAFDNISATDTLTVTINNINQVPTANPGGPYTATAGKELTLNGSKSQDPDGSITEYIWDFGDGKTGSGVKPVYTYTKAGEYTVTLKVKDDKGALSAAVTTKVTVKEAEKTYPVNKSPITNSTSVIGYTEVTVDQLVKIFIDRKSTKVEWARRIAPLYINYGKLFNIRADIAWAQMCHETGFLEYTGDVKPNQNNFVGMGAIGGGVSGDSFATEELGIIAHYAHLAWYYYPNHVNIYCSAVYDPRHFGSTHYKYTGDTTLGFMNGRWAPGSNYTDKIILFANKIYGF